MKPSNVFTPFLLTSYALAVNRNRSHNSIVPITPRSLASAEMGIRNRAKFCVVCAKTANFSTSCVVVVALVAPVGLPQ